MTRQQALIAIHIAAVLFGLTGVFGQLIAAGAEVIVFGRAAFAVAALLLFARMQRRPLWRGTIPRQRAVMLLSGALLTAHWIMFFISVKTGGIAVATLGFASFPAFITLVEVLVFRERVGPAEWLRLAMVTGGLVLVTPSFDIADQGTMGLAWGVASGLAFALLALTNRRAAAGIDPIQIACWQNMVVLLIMLPAAAPQLPALHVLDWLWLGLLGVFCTGLSHYLFVSSLAALNARSVGLVIALEPVYAIGFAWTLFGQQPSLRMGGGAILIMAAILWAGLGRSDTGPADRQQPVRPTLQRRKRMP